MYWLCDYQVRIVNILGSYKLKNLTFNNCFHFGGLAGNSSKCKKCVLIHCGHLYSVFIVTLCWETLSSSVVFIHKTCARLLWANVIHAHWDFMPFGSLGVEAIIQPPFLPLSLTPFLTSHLGYCTFQMGFYKGASHSHNSSSLGIFHHREWWWNSPRRWSSGISRSLVFMQCRHFVVFTA